MENTDALAAVRRFNARLSAKGSVMVLVIACDSCDTVIDFDLTVKWRDSNTPMRWITFSRYNGHGRMRMAGLSR